ncbi:N-acetylmuramoyl-L-alanine amidase [Streptomyces sp. SID5643]|uniref:peptidoglycan recognition protein family protein n=1 Tax=Streptomyces sp. SID5643 TaxID=2690307 RepID=UPI0013691394|nr:N-acetylmuramoyl-L-alanine amidase [Streptomyces sp. SID5643]MZF88848.1 N-acetylmuramoyl-L-alanine amidase [Streptomyces sp. SID5643]
MPERYVHDEDVKAAIERPYTGDGPGTDNLDDLPESDFGLADGDAAAGTIPYDRPVADFIDELSATGHVTHTSYRKTSVTLHHNAGRLSHQGVLDVWKVRPASAHFDVDAAGAVAQYVKVHEYAWAVGNTAGNQGSISIEMANTTLAPNWRVGAATWKNAARLAGWLFAEVIGESPSRSNLFYHHHWSSTVCAGPYMDQIYDEVLAAAQVAYDHFQNEPPTLRPDSEPASVQRRR